MTSINLSPYKNRRISGFVAHELLYDYLTDQLDDERKRAVEIAIKEDPTNQKIIADMKKALNYVEKINRIEVTQDFLEEMNESSNYISSVLKKTQFEKWPASVKWSIEAMVVLVGIILFLVVVPWDQALKVTLFPKDKDVILAEINRENSNINAVNLAEIEKKETPQFPDEDKKSTLETEKADPPAIVLAEKDKKQISTKAPVTLAPPPTIPQVPTAAKPPQTEVAAKSSEEISSEDSEKKSGGFLYRGQLEITNVEMNSPKITEKILELGGRKAGEVEIGWKKSDATYYYHFTLPEAKYEELVTFFSEYTEAKLKKEKHPRVMPDGIIRLIITVDEKKHSEAQ